MSLASPKTSPLPPSDPWSRAAQMAILRWNLTVTPDAWLKNLDAAMQRVRTWCSEHESLVRGCFCQNDAGVVDLQFVSVGPQFDFRLADLLARLELDLMQTFKLGLVEAGQIPATAVQTWIHPDAIRVYGGERESYRAMET